jgi:hypothetical protein
MDNIFKGIEVRENSNCKELTTIALNRFFSVSTNQSNLLEEALGGASVSLSSDDLVEIERAVPRGAVAGERYPVEQMAWLDSERPSR